jgi:hypothetical protein
MSLPLAWVDALFARLSVRYGAAFMRQYADLEIGAVKADWSDVLGGFAGQPEAIRYALDNLPADKPPTAGQFRLLCNSAPVPEVKAIAHDAPPADPERVAELVQTAKVQPQRDPRAWARRLRDIELNRAGVLPSGDRMTRAQREIWREALRAETEAV